MSRPKADNLLTVLALLRSRGQLTARQIADELGVNTRTVYRYIDSLSASGAPIASEPGVSGGYLLLETAYDPPLFLTDRERRAIAHAARFAERSGYPYSDAIDSALEKLRSRMDERQIDDLERHVSRFHVLPTDRFAGEGGGEPSRTSLTSASGGPGTIGPDGSTLGTTLRLLEECVADGRSVWIRHRKPADCHRDNITERQVDPWGIVYWRENWYLVAWCHLRQGERSFRADRIVSCRAGERTFTPPDGPSASERFLSAMVPHDPDSPPVVIRVEGSEGGLDAMCRHWFLSYYLTERTENEAVFHLTCPKELEFLPIVMLSFGRSIRVTEPPELVERIGEYARRLVEHYSDVPPEKSAPVAKPEAGSG